jgi:hypothetical protein
MIAGEIWLCAYDIPELTSEIGVVLRVKPDYDPAGLNIRSVRVVPRERLLFYDGQEFKRNECKNTGWRTISFHVRYAICYGIIIDGGINDEYRQVAMKVSNQEYRNILSHAIRRYVIEDLGTAVQTYESASYAGPEEIDKPFPNRVVTPEKRIGEPGTD